MADIVALGIVVYHCTGCNDYGGGVEAVYGLRVIHRHKLAFLP